MANELSEKLGVLTAKVEAAHRRIDDVEGEIKDSLKDIHSDLKELNAHMNKGRGWAAAALLIAGLLGAGILEAFKLIFQSKGG